MNDQVTREGVEVTRLDVVMRYMEIFYSGNEMERLYLVLADGLKFQGPFHRFESSHDYVASLLADPPVGCTYRIVNSFENGDWINLVYDFSKPDVQTLISQLFEVRGNQITRMILIFDTGAFV